MIDFLGFFQKAGTKSNRIRANLFFAAVILLIIVEAISFFFAWTVLQSESLQHHLPWLIFGFISSTTILLLLIGSKVFTAQEAARSEAIAEYIHDGLLFIEGSKITFANSTARAILGLPCVSSALKSEIKNVLEQTKASSLPIVFEKEIEGQKNHFLVSQIRIPHDRAADIDRRIVVFQDVTFLREKEEAKVNFIGILSHEIKTPVTSLAMALAMLERTGYDAELVRIANSDVARLRILLEDLLNVSKLNAVQSTDAFLMQETNLSPLVRQILKSLTAMTTEKNISIEIKIQPRGPILANVDPTKLSWVITTLLKDALRQSPTDGTILVELSVEEDRAIFIVTGKVSPGPQAKPTGHAVVRDIIEAHAGRFSAVHDTKNGVRYKFSINAYASSPLREVNSNEANLVG